MFTQKTSLIIPTKNRSSQLVNLFNQLIAQKINFNEIIVVDSSNKIHAKKNKLLCNNHIRYFHTKSSTAYQRNFGLSKIKQNNFVMFMDDDIILLKDTFKNINKCIKKSAKKKYIAGFGFNQIQEEKNSFLKNFKKNSLLNYFDIYPSVPGKIAKSGWHSKILNLKKDVLADWVFTTICIYKLNDIKELKFDESFGRYSYLEDLDFSLNLIKQKKKILISSKAKFLHPENIDRSNFKFGVTEIINRFKIVKKHSLSKKLFLIAALLRFFMSLLRSLTLNKKYFMRSMGNIYSLFKL